MQQAEDFRAESAALHDLVRDLPTADFTRPTLFKDWTLDDIFQHLHFFNVMAHHSLAEPDRFQTDYGAFSERRKTQGMVGGVRTALGDLAGPDLVAAWWAYIEEMAPVFAAADPKHRVKWAGPDMSARSSITARLMETWAHGQAIYDLLGVERRDGDRIRNIAHLGVTTFGWTFVNRGLEVPDPMPCVRLTAPSGAIWEWGEAGGDSIEGRATEFCQVVCQTRNIADTALQVTGETATRWMAMAQCFAGPPNDPPTPGARRMMHPA